MSGRPALVPTSALSAANIAEIRRRIGDHLIFRLYFETALEALQNGEDNRRFLLSGAGGLIQAIDFDTLTVMTATGTVTGAEAGLLTTAAGATELHLPPAHAEPVRRIAHDRITGDLELRYSALSMDHAVEPGPHCQRLGPDNLAEIRAFARRHNPKTVFSDWMIELPVFGLRIDGVLMAIGGVITTHAGLGACMLGNFVTAPFARRRGHAKSLCRTLVAAMANAGYQRIALCTAADNVAACRAYETVGFRCLETRVQIDLAAIGTES